MTSGLTAADLRFINRVASRRFAGTEPVAPDAARLEAAIATRGDGTPTGIGAALVCRLLAAGVFPTVPEHTALLALHCSLALQGLRLLTAQGVLVGMLRTVAAAGDATGFQHWLDDRTVPAASDA